MAKHNSHGDSPFYGVTAAADRWRVQIKGKVVGDFVDPELAAAVYDFAVLALGHKTDAFNYIDRSDVEELHIFYKKLGEKNIANIVHAFRRIDDIKGGSNG